MKPHGHRLRILVSRPRLYCIITYGEVAERFKAPVLKTGDPKRIREFESHPLRHFLMKYFNLSIILIALSFSACGHTFSYDHNHTVSNSLCQGLEEEDDLQACKSRAQKSLEHRQTIRSEGFYR